MKSDRSKKSSTPTKAGSSKASTSGRKPLVKPAPARKEILEIPSILLEGDAPPQEDRSGPGERFSLGTHSLGAPADVLSQALPEAYGTRKLLLIARDPHWLYAHWDFTSEQLRECNAKSIDKHLVLRVHKEAIEDTPFAEIHVHPESRHWFIHVGRGSTRFLSELGYYSGQRRWTRVTVSEATLTPPETVSDDRSARFATLTTEVSVRQLVSFVKSAARQHEALSETLHDLRESGHPSLPSDATVAGAPWTPEQDRALAEMLSIDEVRRVWIGSLEITELIRGQMAKELSSAAAAQFSHSLPELPSSLGVSSLSSPFGGASGDRRKGFWFNVNAELIIYGATEPDAQVTIGGRVIKLRSDGSFSYRFALPDGHFDLPAVAVSSDKTDARSAELKFSRQTSYAGEVGKHPQDAALRPPRVENIR